MDTSENYVRMCEKASEIQGKVNLYGQAELATLSDGIHCLVHRNEVYSDYYYTEYVSYIASEYKAKVIWLPRQDQLQEMLLPGFNAKDAEGYPVERDDKIDAVFWVFLDFSESLQERKWSQQTGEQLWLRYFMQKKYEKTWNGSKWI